MWAFCRFFIVDLLHHLLQQLQRLVTIEPKLLQLRKFNLIDNAVVQKQMGLKIVLLFSTANVFSEPGGHNRSRQRDHADTDQSEATELLGFA